MKKYILMALPMLILFPILILVDTYLLGLFGLSVGVAWVILLIRNTYKGKEFWEYVLVNVLAMAIWIIILIVITKRTSGFLYLLPYAFLILGNAFWVNAERKNTLQKVNYASLKFIARIVAINIFLFFVVLSIVSNGAFEPYAASLVSIIGLIYLILVKKVRGIKLAGIIALTIMVIVAEVFFTIGIIITSYCLVLFYVCWTVYKTNYKGVKLIIATIISLLTIYWMLMIGDMTLTIILPPLLAIIIERFKKKKVEIIEE